MRGSRVVCTRSRRCRSRLACSSPHAATMRRRCSAASTTDATRTRSPRWAVQWRPHSARRCRASGSTRSGPRASSISRSRDGRWPRSRRRSWRRTARDSRRGRLPSEPRRPFEGDVDPAGGSRGPRAPAGPRGREGRRCDRGAVARRGRPAGTRPRRLAGGLATGAAAARRRAARRARRAAAAPARRRAGRAAARADPGPRAGHRPDPRRLARPCSRLRAREAGREHLARGHPGDRRRYRQLARPWVVHRGRPRPRGDGAVSVEQGVDADEPRREHRRHPGGRRPQLHHARRRAARACRRGLLAARRCEGLARLSPAGADLHGGARRDAQPARRLPAAGHGDAAQPVPRVDRSAVARRRLRLVLTGRPGARCAHGSHGREPQSHRERRLRADVDGRRSRRVALGGQCRGVRRRRTRRRPAAEQARRGAALCARARRSLGGPRRRDLRAVRPLSLGARDQQHRARRGRAVRVRRLLLGDLRRRAGRARHRHERRGRGVDLRCAASDRVTLVGAAARPVPELAARLRRDHARRARRAHTRRRMTFDPLVPRPIDLPTPIDGDLDRAKIIAAPDDPEEWPAWRESLAAWRERARQGYDGSAYERLEWTQGCFSVGLVWLWDERLYDHVAQRFTPDRLLAEADQEFGGYDAVVLWHAYPVIGIDERNQFDWYRDVPGIRELVAAFQQRDVRVFVDYNPWDLGTRREPQGDAQAVAELVRELGADGVFLDTMKEAMPELRAALPDAAFEGESTLPLERIADHHLSWAQWFADSDVPGVIRARWFEQRHMLHHTRRWNRSHSEELRSAWLNGVGMLVWESVFGSWVGWSERDKATLRGMVAVQRRWTELLTRGEWTPLCARSDDLQVVGSCWRLGGEELWALANRGDAPFDGQVALGDRQITLSLAPLGLAAVTA